MPKHFREVIREHHFEKQLRALARQAIRADRFVEGAEFLLARASAVIVLIKISLTLLFHR